MIPQEKITNVSFNGTPQPDPVPDFQDIGPSRITGTSRFTGQNGQFLDAPYGFCLPEIFTSYKFTQQIGIKVGDQLYSVRGQTVTVTSTASGSGTISNASGDINKSRP
jgi:hypothetical protein